MTARDFCYWLQGSLELASKNDGFSPAQVEVIKNHLSLVFVHDIDTPDPTGELQAVHDGKPVEPAKPKPTSGTNSKPTVHRC